MHRTFFWGLTSARPQLIRCSAPVNLFYAATLAGGIAGSTGFKLAFEQTKRNFADPNRLKDFALAIGKQALEVPIFEKFERSRSGFRFY
jgi:hypothetical protein